MANDTEVTRVNELIEKAVREAIRVGVSPQAFISRAQTEWEFEMHEKVRRDDRVFRASTFVSAQNGATK